MKVEVQILDTKIFEVYSKAISFSYTQSDVS